MACTFNQTIDYKNSLTIGCLMGVNLRVIKPKSPIVLAHVTSILATQHWNLSIWLNMNLLPPKKLTIFFLFSFSDLVSILVPYSSSFCSIEVFFLSLPSYASRSTSSLLIPLLILQKTRSLVDLLIFCTLGATREEWKKIKCKGWNGREGPTFILSGPIKLFPKIITLFAKHRIGSWILIWAKCCSFLLDFENVLLPKHDIDSLMPFSCSFHWISKTCYYQNEASVHWCPFHVLFCWIPFQWKGKRCQWMWEDGFYFHPSISHPQH